ncbi:MAG: hypothetical protein GY820_38390 [Gammaproteobacteria bacterium]|nr:hypothetical protein [Gammaproteobacteria bacterium]
MSDKDTELHSYLQFTKNGADAMLDCLDIARKHGTITEAGYSLNFMAAIRENAKSVATQVANHVEKIANQEEADEIESD